jgi:transposase
MSRVMNIKDNVTERRHIFEQQVREKLIEDEIPPRESAINRMSSLNQNKRTMYKRKLKSAKTVNELNAIVKEAESSRQKIRKAAELTAVTAKKRLSETNKMRAMVKENMKFNEKLAEKRRQLREKSKPKWNPEDNKRL